NTWEILISTRFLDARTRSIKESPKDSALTRGYHPPRLEVAPVRYGVNMMVWTTRVGEHLAPLFCRIRDWGFDGVELFLSPEEPANIAAVTQILDHLKLERTTCSVLPREVHLVSPDATVRAQGVEFLKKCVDRTGELGAQLMCGPIYAGLGL